MKKMIIPIAIVGFSFFVFSCSKNNEVPVEQQILGKWTMESAAGHFVVMGVPDKDTTWFTASDYFEFKSDHMLVIEETGEQYAGKWEIVGGKVKINETNYMDYAPDGFDIPKLTGNQLQLHYAETQANSSLEMTLSLKK